MGAKNRGSIKSPSCAETGGRTTEGLTKLYLEKLLPTFGSS